MRASILSALLLALVAASGVYGQADYGTTAPAKPATSANTTTTTVTAPKPVPVKTATTVAPAKPAPAEPARPMGRNINTWLKVTPLLSTSFQVVIAGGVNAIASDNTTVATCFFPSDSAWVKFLQTIGLTRQELLDNGPLVQKLARTMFVPHVGLRTMDFAPGQKLATLQEETLTIRETADVFVVVGGRSSAAITVPDLQAVNSFIHIVDTVLVPNSVNIQKI